MTDTARLDAVVDHLRMNPRRHKQTVWAKRDACGTAHCLAGWTMVLAGWDQFEWDEFNDQNVAYADNVEYHGAMVPIRLAAMHLLDLEPKDASVLFAANNTFEDIEQMAKNLSNGDPIRKNITRCLHDNGVDLNDPEEEEYEDDDAA